MYTNNNRPGPGTGREKERKIMSSFDESMAYVKRFQALIEFCDNMDTDGLSPLYNLLLFGEKLNETPYRKSSIRYTDLQLVLDKFREAYNHKA